MRILCRLVLGVGLLSPVLAWADTPDRPALAHAAGYKALFTCGASFDATRSVEDINAGELARIYPDARAALATLPAAEIDRTRRIVAVPYVADMPPRLAAWRDHFGCTLLPIGGTAAMIESLPALAPIETPEPADPPQATAPETLAPVIAAAFDRSTYGAGTETTAVIVARADALLAEQYRADFGPNVPQRTWSVAKSIAATLIGAAVKEGLVTLDAPATLPEWTHPDDPRRAITLTHLLHMSSGLDSGPVGSRTDAVYFGGARVVDHAGRRSLTATPGRHWTYANNDTLLAVRTLRQAFDSDEAYWTWVRGTVRRLGMLRTTVGVDWSGDYILSSQVWTSARDLMRLGQVYLTTDESGDASDAVLPADWPAYVSTPAPAQPPATRADGTPLPGYGAQFWLFDERHGLHVGTYAAMGHRGQYLIIVPERNLVVVRRGFDDSGGTRFAIARFTADILAALND